LRKEKFEKMKRFEGKLASTMTDACQRRATCSAKAEVTPLRRDTEKLNYIYESKSFIDQRNTLQSLRKSRLHDTATLKHNTNNTRGKCKLARK
jgi:hypothetical protein